MSTLFIEQKAILGSDIMFRGLITPLFLCKLPAVFRHIVITVARRFNLSSGMK